MRPKVQCLFASLFLWMAACQDEQRSSVQVASRPDEPKLRLSEVRFTQVRFEGTPEEVVNEINAALHKVGFKDGLKLEGESQIRSTRIELYQVTYREVVDQICLQLELSYWDNDKAAALHLQGGLQSSFDVYTRDEMGWFIPAGPREASPPGYKMLPLRSESFNRIISRSMTEK